MEELNPIKKKELITKLKSKYQFIVDMGLFTEPLDEFLEIMLEEPISKNENVGNLFSFLWKKAEKRISDWAVQISQEKDLISALWEYAEKQAKEEQPEWLFMGYLNRLKLSFDIDFYLDFLMDHPEIIERIDCLEKKQRKNLCCRYRNNESFFYAYRLIKSSEEEPKERKETFLFDEEWVKEILVKENAQQYFKEIREFPILNQKQIYEYSLREKAGDTEARQRLIESHLRYVFERVLLKYQREREAVVDFLELIQEGNIGLVSAVEHFEPKRRIQFTSYANWWIDSKINNALITYQRPTNVTPYISFQKNRLDRIISQFEKENDRKPSIEELAKRANRTKESTEQLLRSALNVASFNQERNSHALTEEIESPYWQIEDMEQRILLDEFDKEMKRIVTDKQYTILRMLYKENIDGETLGKKLGITRQAVHQQELKALRALRRSNVIQSFFEAMDHPTEALTYLYLCRSQKNKKLRKEIEYTEEEYQMARKKAVERLRQEEGTKGKKNKKTTFHPRKKGTTTQDVKLATNIQVGMLTERATLIKKEENKLDFGENSKEIENDPTATIYQKQIIR